MTSLSPKALLAKARAEEKAGRKKAAASLYAQLGMYLLRRERFADARLVLSRVVTLSPESPRPYLWLALSEVKSGNEEAAKHWMLFFTRYTMKKRKVETYAPYMESELKAYPALRQTFYEGLLAVDRTTALPFLALARTLAEQEKYEVAQGVLLDALKTKSMDREVIEVLRTLLARQGHEQELILLQRFERGKLAREDLIALLKNAARGGAAVEAGKAKEKDLKGLIEELEGELGIRADSELDEVEPLLKEFRRQAEPLLAGDAQARLDMATAYFEMGLYAPARDELGKITPESPLFLVAQCLLGEVLAEEGSDLGALEVYQKVLRSERADEKLQSEARYRLIEIYLRLSDVGQALTHFRELEVLNSQYRDVKTLKQRIQDALGEEVRPAVKGRTGLEGTASPPLSSVSAKQKRRA